MFEPRLNVGDPVNITVEIWEDHGDSAAVGPASISVSVPDPWKPGVSTLGGGPKIQVRVTRTLIAPTDVAFLARAGLPAKIGGVLVVPQGFVVDITDILGLYKINPAAAPGVPGSTHVAGYFSEDDLGRIFTNRLSDGTWQSDTQYIEVQVKISAFGASTIPAGGKIKWTLVDVDDPTNDSSEFHREWGRYVDQNDYDAAGIPLGAHPDDNALAYSPGNANELLLYGAAANAAPTARWAQATGGPAVSPLSGAQAQSDLTRVDAKTATSAVRLHCPNVLGTNFVLKAALTGAPGAIPVHDANTGVMTMWSRIDIEVVRMAGAHSVSGALPAIPASFKPICVQMDFQPERAVGGALDKAQMATSERLEDTATTAWVSNAAVFAHVGQGGWFFLGAARLPSPPGAGSSSTIYNNTAYTLGVTGNDPFVRVPKSLAKPDYVEFTWTDLAGNSLIAGFHVESRTRAGGKTKIKLSSNDVTPGFTGHDADGSIDHAYLTEIDYYPQHQRPSGGAALVAGGYGVPAAGANVEISAPGFTFTTGISPTVHDAAGLGDYFAGRTVLFTQTPSFSTGPPPTPTPDFDDEVLSTVVHEFLHAFGMPHKCGFWNWRTPRALASGHTCCMNYFDTWLIDSANNVIPGTRGFEGNDMCGRHLMEVRRVHLERNKGLRW
jgi:hypothetical protein